MFGDDGGCSGLVAMGYVIKEQLIVVGGTCACPELDVVARCLLVSPP